MKYIIKNDIEDLKYKYLGSGKFGDCYLTKNNFVFKEFTCPCNKETEETLFYECNINNKSFMFPLELIYKNDKDYTNLIGYLKKYSDGTFISDIDSNEKLENILRSIIIFEKNIKEISKYKIRIFDLKNENVLYSKDNMLEVIDTDFYKVDNSLNYRDIIKCNMMELEYLISTNLIKINPYCLSPKKLFSYYESTSDGKMLVSDYLYEIINEINKTIDYDIKSYSDFNDGIKLLLK